MINLATVKPGDMLVFIDGQMREVERIEVSYDYVSGTGSYGGYGYGDMYKEVRSKYWRVTLTKPMDMLRGHDGPRIIDLKADGAPHYEPDACRVKHVVRAA